MNFDFDEDQQELRGTVRRFLEHSSAEADVRRLMATEQGYDRAVWERMAAELGLHGLAIPGLYAAGECAGGVLGDVYMGSGNALASAVTFGRIAGASAAARALGPRLRA